jgi:hypothetical protein
VVQKKILETGLGDVNVGKLNGCSGSEIGDFRDERASAIGVDIGGAIVVGRGADLADP